MKKRLIMAGVSLFLAGCGRIVVWLKPAPKPATTETPLARRANQLFWNQFHQGNYDSLTQVTALLDAAYLDTPNDVKIVSHLGFAHIWAFSETQRQGPVSPTVLDHFLLSKRYFAESRTLNPHDPRVLGFLADTRITEGTISKNPKLVVGGYFDGLKAIRQWPEFNKFTLGYVFSQTDTASKQFNQALNWQWETLDDCSCRKQNRNTIDYAEVATLIKNAPEGHIRRACWNSWIAPHNWEGFFLNFGDMLVKRGDWRKGIDLYQAAKQSPTYDQWPYRAELERRIINAQQNVTAFNQPIDRQGPGYAVQTVMMVNSAFSCMGCHQMSTREFADMGYQEPSARFYAGKN